MAVNKPGRCFTKTSSEVGQTFTGQTEQVIESPNRTVSIRKKHTKISTKLGRLMGRWVSA